MTLFTPFHKWVTEEHKLFTDSVQKFYNDEMKPNIEDWVDNGVVPKSFWEKGAGFGSAREILGKRVTYLIRGTGSFDGRL